MLSDGFVALGGFGDLWLFADRETTYRLRRRNFRADLVAGYPCLKCGAKAGELCRRVSAGGVLSRRLPHVGRGPASGKQGGLPRKGEA